MVRTFAAAAALIFAGSALAVPTGAFWVEVNNGGIADTFPLPPAGQSLAGFRTFDLYVQLQAGDVLFAADFGIAGPNAGVSTTQAVFQGNLGSDTQTAATPGFNETVEFDTHIALGNANGLIGEVTLPVGAINWNPAGFSGAWAVAVPIPGSAGPDFGLAAWMARITVTSAGGFGALTGVVEFLGGQFFVSGTGPGGNFGQQVPATGVVGVGNAFPIPTPGAVALFGLAGCVVTRRRR